jgi:hypothetical protein
MAERLTIAKIKEAIANADGVIAEAARTLGVSRMTIYRRIEESDDLRAAVEDAREELTDIAERELGKAIRAGNMTAIIFHLKGSPNGRRRGYSERVEMTGPDGGPMVVKGYVSVSPDEWSNAENQS